MYIYTYNIFMFEFLNFHFLHLSIKVFYTISLLRLSLEKCYYEVFAVLLSSHMGVLYTNKQRLELSPSSQYSSKRNSLCSLWYSVMLSGFGML